MQTKAKGLAVIVLGLPGAGKNTVAEMAAKHGRLHHIQTGEHFRKVAPEITRTGELAPDKLADEFVFGEIAVADPHSIIVLNGYPRTKAQSEKALGALRRVGYRVLVIELRIPLETSIDRQLERYQKAVKKGHPARPEDSDIKIVNRRSHTHNDQIEDVLNFLIREKVQFVRIMATPPPEQVAATFIKTITEVQRDMGLPAS